MTLILLIFVIWFCPRYLLLHLARGATSNGSLLRMEQLLQPVHSLATSFAGIVGLEGFVVGALSTHR